MTASTSSTSVTKWLLHHVILILTFSYHGPLHDWTIDPMKCIAEEPEQGPNIRPLLKKFRELKEAESSFIKKAATVSAAAVLAVFSWTDVPDAFWLAKLFWHSSLWLSLFALISTAPKRVLENFPELEDKGTGIPEDFDKVPDKEITKILDVLLTRHGSNKSPDKKIIWALQAPTMMTSYAWLCFLLGYGLYLITPLLDGGDWTVQKTSAVIVTCVGGLTLTNFMICQFITKLKVKYAREIQSGGPLKEKVNAREETTKKSAESIQKLGHHVVDIEG